MKELKSKLSLTLDASVIERLRTLSEEDDRSLSQYINLVLKNHLKEIDAKSATDKSE